MASTVQTDATLVLRDDNLTCIEKLTELVERLSDAEYREPIAPCDSGIGAHVRHVLDHYDAFISGLTSGTVDYDRRERDGETQVVRARALARLATVSDQLSALKPSQLPEKFGVIMDCGSAESTSVSASSTPMRELQFLVSHTVHHDALIGASVRALNITIDERFGVAPSTLRYSDCVVLD